MTNVSFHPYISPAVLERFPDYHALSVVITGYAPTAKLSAPAVQCAPWCEAHLEAWREAYRGFGAAPKKTPSSLESLFRRFNKDGALPVINDLVDTYNALSLNWGAPFGGEDISKYAGSPRLIIADGSEPFDTMKDGALITEHPEPGEIVWCDDLGVTCRRWNWRQCKRTTLTPDSSSLWFVIDRLHPMPLDALQSAGQALKDCLLAVSPGAAVDVEMLGRE